MKLKHKFINLNVKDKIGLISLIILLCVFIMFYLLKSRIIDVLKELTKSETSNISTYIINESVNDAITNEIDFNELLNTVTNKNGEIISIDFDTIKVNNYLIKINSSVLKNLKDIENGNLENLDSNIFYSEKLNNRFMYYIPFGIITNNLLLEDIGPHIPIKITLSGSVNSNIKTELTSYGINNSLLKICILVNVRMKVVLPFISEEVSINNEIPVLIKMINGSIPEVYGGNYAISSPITSLD